MDVLATEGRERVALEIETGLSDAVENVRQNLLSGFDCIIAIATTKAALKKVEHQLAEAGLLIPGRVGIGLRESFSM